MTYQLIRTSMSLDGFTLQALDALAKKWGISKAEVMRRAIGKLREHAEEEERRPRPLKAFDWLQSGGGLVKEEAEQFRAEVKAEREAKRYWWEQ
jgi:Arc/MetJ-type ribon-helix-helix transcriptional regulator